MHKEVGHAIPDVLEDGYYLDGDMDESHYIEQHLMILNVVLEEGGNLDDEHEEGGFHLEKGRIIGLG